MGRQSCSIQHSEASVDAAVAFRAQFNRSISSVNEKEKAMKKITTIHKDEIRFQIDTKKSILIRQLLAKLSIATMASLVVLGLVGNQSA